MVPTDQGHVEQFLLLEDLDKPSAEIGEMISPSGKERIGKFIS